MDTITLTQTVKYNVTFHIDDFENDEQWNQFVHDIKNDDDKMIQCFIENIDRNDINSDNATDITIE